MTDGLSFAILAAPSADVAAQACIQNNSTTVTVFAKVMLALKPEGTMTLAGASTLHKKDIHERGNPASTVTAACDRAPQLTRGAVTLSGHAYGGQSGRCQTRLSVYPAGQAAAAQPIVDKHVLVAASEGFAHFPLRYEKAYGGLGFIQNPIGVGHGSGDPEPNLQNPADPKQPACYAPLAAIWPTRKALLKKPLKRRDLDRDVVTLPADFDANYFQVAPVDQQLDWQGDEWVVLSNLHPQTAQLRSQLPGLKGKARISNAEGLIELDLKLYRLHLEPDQNRAHALLAAEVELTGHLTTGKLTVAAAVGTAEQPPRLLKTAPGSMRRASLQSQSGPSSAPTSEGSEALEGTQMLDRDNPQGLNTSGEKNAATVEGTITMSNTAGAQAGQAAAMPFLQVQGRKRTGGAAGASSGKAASVPGAPWSGGAPPSATPVAAAGQAETLSMHVETHAAPARKPAAPVTASPTLPEAAAEPADDAAPSKPEQQYQADAWNARWDDMPDDAQAPAKKAKPPRKPNFRLPAPSVDVKEGLYGNFRGGRN